MSRLFHKKNRQKWLPIDIKLDQIVWKTERYNKNPYCAICKRRITTMEDASIDHIVAGMYSPPGDYSNLQLTHKECNFEKEKRLKVKLSDLVKK